jgi:hypothetical protein
MMMYRGLKNVKPPKLRFKPGMFVREKNTSELYCIRVIYRLANNPHEWCYYLEERKDLGDPSTPLSVLCQRIAGYGMNGCLLHYPPVRDVSEVPGERNLYRYGDAKSDVPNQKLLNDYTVISSGELS